MDDEKLFDRIQECMNSRKLFVDSKLNRKKVAELLSTNEIYIANAIRNTTGNTFLKYIAELRLKYALELMIEHPDIDLDIIAADSGHGSYTQFFRTFTQKYGISPSEYRRLARFS